MPFEYTNRARNTSTNALVYWVTKTSADPNMTAPNAPDPNTHAQSVVVARRQVDEAATSDPNFAISFATRHVLRSSTSLDVSVAASRTQ